MSRLSPRQRYGLAGERLALAMLQAHGYAGHLVSDWLADIDVIVEGCLPVEVKIARPRRHWNGQRYRTRWQFDVSRLPRSVDSLVVLIAEDDAGRPWVYLVPSWELWGRRTIQITSHPRRYAGRLAPYLEAWETVERVLSERRRRQPAGQLWLPLMAGEVVG